MGKLRRWLMSCKAEVSEEGSDGGPETNQKPCCVSGNTDFTTGCAFISRQVGGKER